MASTHKSLRSSTANKRPTTSIADGQIALNTNSTSPGLFFKDSTGGTIIKIGPVHVGTTAPNATPAAGGSSGNSTGEIWLDTSLTPVGVKIWNAGAWTNATPIGSTTVQGLLELATNAETQTGADTARAVTPAGLQSKVSDSTSTTSSTTIASSTAVKSAYDLANAALPKSGGTVTGNLEIGATGSLTFEGSTADGFETALAVVDPTADRTITLPNVSGTVITTGDTGTITSTMIADGTIVNGDVNASAAIAGTKISPNFGSQTIQTTGIVSHALGSAGAPTLTFTGDTNTGIYSPGADQVAISTNGQGRLFVDANGGIRFPDGNVYGKSDSTGNLAVYGGGAYNQGAGIVLHGTSHATNPNVIQFVNNAFSEKMRITSDGKVGIGTSSPAGRLHVFGGDSIFGATSYTRILNADRVIDFTNAAQDTYVAGRINGLSLKMYGNNGNGIDIDSSGRVGIGTSVPQNLLHLRSDVNGAATHLYLMNRTSGASVESRIAFTTSANDLSDNRHAYIGTVTTGVGENGNSFVIATNPNGNSAQTRVFVSSTGSVGIGTTSPTEALEVVGNAILDASNATLKIKQGVTGTTGAIDFTLNSDSTSYGSLNLVYDNRSTQGLRLNTSYPLTLECGVAEEILFKRTTTESARIDSSGRLLVGTSTARSDFFNTTSFAPRLQVEGTDFSSSMLSVTCNATGANPNLVLARSRGTANGAATVVADGDSLGNIEFQGADGTDLVSGASIAAVVDGTPGSNDMPGRLIFSTTADGASTPTERLRIDSSGYLKAQGVYDDTSVAAANVVVTINGNLRRSSSSIKYKTNVETLEDSYADAILNCRPVWYQSTCPGDNPNYGHWGFIAEEVAEIDPRLCSFKEQEDGTLDPEGVQYDRFVPHLLNLIKRQGEAIAALQAEVAALKAR